MLNAIIQFSLRYRLVVLCSAVAVMIIGSIVARSLPIDVLPKLTRPRVVLLTECPGMAPEEVEQRVTFPLESVLNGAPGVVAVRSASDIGLSVIYVEFDWGAEIYTARQIVQERISTAQERLPEGIEPQMGPISSLLGQIVMVGMWSTDGTTDALELRTIADWNVRQRLLTIPGISQVITMGGGRKQYQVLIDPHALHKFELTLAEVEEALRQCNLNVTGGYVDKGSQEMLVRGLGLIGSLDDLKQVVVKHNEARPILLEQIAAVQYGAETKRGESSVNGKLAVVLNIQKQPGADTRLLTEEIEKAINDLRPSLPSDVVIDATIYQQRQFIDFGVTNVASALRDGAILVVIVLFVFLLNFRTTFITLTAIPLSVLVTALVFRWLDLSINVMTLGGLAVALGELVDDAIVDVENIFRRIRENRQLSNPKSTFQVVFDASYEVRGAIIISTVLVIVVFAPLFALSGIQGRMFMPLGVAYIVSIVASTVVSLTVTPVLSYYLLPHAKATESDRDGWFLGFLKRLAAPIIRFSMTSSGLSIVVSGLILLVLISGIILNSMGKDFLPPFDEGAAQVNLFAPPGTSLAASRAISQIADQKFTELLKTPENPDGPLLSFICRTGRAELDEHVMGVNVSEYIMTLNPDSELDRGELIRELHHVLEDVPGIESEVEQPIAHLISHMISGVTAQIAIKLYGTDLQLLRRKADEIKDAISDIEGIAPPFVEQLTLIPQLRVEVMRDKLAVYGISSQFVLDSVEIAMSGRVVSQVIEGQRTFDLLVRLNEKSRQDLTNLHRLQLELPDGKRVPLGEVANVYEAAGPNTINRDGAKRRIVVRVNTEGSDLGSAVAEIEKRIAEEVELPEGYFVIFGGQFEAQREATKRLMWLSAIAIAAVFVVLYSAFPSTSIVLQILAALPAAFVGGVFALLITGQSLSVAGMVGFISLGGIAARNGLLLVSTYLDLAKEKGFSKEMILQGSLDRLAPVMMTSLTTGLGLVPLVIGGHEPGKEILLPIATVLLGGLTTSTICEFLLRPGLFYAYSEKAVERLADEGEAAEE